MNFRKIFASLILSVATLGAFACQYEYSYIYAEAAYKRCLYLSGINVPGNHISGITIDDNGYTDTNPESPTYGYDFPRRIAYYDAKNHVVVSQPMTVYVGVADLNNGARSHGEPDYGADLQNITLVIQYRVLPSTSWHTATTKKFSRGNLNLLTKQKLFGSFQIDADAPAGSTVIVRMYVAVDRYYKDTQDYGSNISSHFWSYVENADQDSVSIPDASNVPANETYSITLMMSGYGQGASGGYYIQELNRLFAGLHFDNYVSGGNNMVPAYFGYVDGWAPQFVMIVKIADKRRPGK